MTYTAVPSRPRLCVWSLQQYAHVSFPSISKGLGAAMEYMDAVGVSANTTEAYTVQVKNNKKNNEETGRYMILLQGRRYM